VYVRRKTSPGRADYYQLVESSRVDGKPRQKVLLHLGQRSSVEEALRIWPLEIQMLRRKGLQRKADDLKSRLERLWQLCPECVGAFSETRWRVARDLQISEGLRWVREQLAAYDWSRCREIRVRRWPGRVNVQEGTIVRFEGRLLPPLETYVWDGEIYGWGYRISAKVGYRFSFPEVIRSGAELHDENEVLVWLIAHEAGHYLLATDQIPGETTEEECDRFADGMLHEYRGWLAS
jgi:hypothetical protein